MARKSSSRSLRMGVLIIGMIVGAGLVIFDQQQAIAGFISGAPTPSLSILDIPIDPTTGGILGTIIFGAPDETGDRSGAVLTPSGLGSCIQDIDPTLGRDLEWKFGRQLIGDPNVAPIWHPIDGNNCAIGYMEWDLRDVPNDFTATSVRFQLELIQKSSLPQGGKCGIIVLDQTLDQIGEMNLGQRSIDIEFSGLGTSIPNPLGSNFPNIPALTIADPDDFWFVGAGGGQTNFGNTQSGEWCETLGIKRWTVGRLIPDREFAGVGQGTFDPQFGVDAFNKALTDGQDRFTMIIVPTRGYGSGVFAVNYDYWKTQGSLLVEGSSPPIRCDAGFELQGFRCVGITCPDGQTVNLSNNMCEPIECPLGQDLQVNLCVPLQCESGQTINNQTGFCENIQCPVGQSFVGSACQDLICDIGFEISGNECKLKTCGTGQELIGDQCQAIQCNTPNTILVGSDCVQRTCNSNELLVDGQCLNITELSFETCSELIPFSDGVLEITDCQTADPTAPIICLAGFKAVGNTCVQLPQNCPEGTRAQENICVQVLPSLMVGGFPELGILSIVGIAIFAGSFLGLVATVIRPS